MRILVILLIAIILARVLKALTTRLVQTCQERQTRVAQMREQQTRTVAGCFIASAPS